MKTEEQVKKIKNKLAVHDWYFEYSDDHRVFVSGNAERTEILNLLRDLGNLSLARELVKQYAKHEVLYTWLQLLENAYEKRA